MRGNGSGCHRQHDHIRAVRPPYAFLTISKPLAASSFRMLIARWEHSSGLIQVALLQSGSSSLEYVVNADRIPASIALVASSGMRASTTCLMRDASRNSRGSVDVDQCRSAGGMELQARSPQAVSVGRACPASASVLRGMRSLTSVRCSKSRQQSISAPRCSDFARYPTRGSHPSSDESAK